MNWLITKPPSIRRVFKTSLIDEVPKLGVRPQIFFPPENFLVLEHKSDFAVGIQQIAEYSGSGGQASTQAGSLP